MQNNVDIMLRISGCSKCSCVREKELYQFCCTVYAFLTCYPSFQHVHKIYGTILSVAHDALQQAESPNRGVLLFIQICYYLIRFVMADGLLQRNSRFLNNSEINLLWYLCSHECWHSLAHMKECPYIRT